jgi:dipicolinate synthase subunit A
VTRASDDTFPWSELIIAVVGGDEREQEVTRLAAATGAEVRAYGFPWPSDGVPGVIAVPDPAAALTGAHVALFPVPGISEEGALFAPAAPEPIVPTSELLGLMAAGAMILLGRADDRLKEAAAATDVTLIEYEDDQELMLLRAPAVVEGAVQLAIEATDITIHGATIAVVGYGNIGSILALTLLRLGARVRVLARNPVQRAHALAVGAEASPLEDLTTVGRDLDMLFATVPARVVDRDVLSALPKGALVMDLAAPPGGIDLDAARELGHKAIWARGQGRRAPITVGQSQWTGVEARIRAWWRGRGL